MTDKRAFLQYFLIIIAYAVGLFFAAYYGLLQAIWAGDVTYMTSVIGAVFLAVSVYLGYATSQLQPQRVKDAEARVGIGRTAAFLVTLIGLLGTAIGLMLQVKAMASVDVNSSKSILAFVATIGGALSTALYATSCGIIGCIGITILTANIEYFIDRERR